MKMERSLLGALRWYERMMAKADPRIASLPLMSSPFPSAFLCVLYLVLVLYVIPSAMSDRKPFQLRIPMLVYNFSMVALAAYIFVELGLLAWFWEYSWGCEPVDYSSNQRAMRMVHVCWVALASKHIELLDTVFFVLRKKNNQVTFLHLFHHVAVVLATWFGAKFAPGGMGTLWVFLNAFVHFVMYLYYGLAALGPKYHKYLWWKRYLTKLQMLQFVIVMIHQGQLLFIDCDYPRLGAYVIFSLVAINLLLFMNFYIQAYIKSNKTPQANGKTPVSNGVNHVHGQNGIVIKEKKEV